MAATQAENQQQNDVNSEKVQPEQHLNLRNTLLQNGTDKNVVRGVPTSNVAVTKAKSSSSSTTICSNSGGGNNSATVKNPAFGIPEMSQYRQQEGSGVTPPQPPPPSTQQPPPSNEMQNSSQGIGGPPSCPSSDSDLNQNVDVAPTNVSQYAPTSSENTIVDSANAPGTQQQMSSHSPALAAPNAMNTPAAGQGVNFPTYPPYAGGLRGPAPVSYGPPPPPPPVPPDQHGLSNDNGIIQTAFGQFGPQGPIRHPGYSPNSKHQSAGSPRGPMGHNVCPPQQPVSQSSPFHHQQRFLSGQSISQPTGPTPTLNQLLQQSTNPIHRIQNSYGHDYGQPWPPVQRPQMSAYGPSQQSGNTMPSYRNQTNMLSSSSYGSSPSPSSPSSYEQQQQQGGGGGQQGQGAPGQRPHWGGSNSSSSQSPQPAHSPSPQTQAQAAGNRQSPQPQQHSPGPPLPQPQPQPQQGPPPSPQQQQATTPAAAAQQQQQQFPSRPSQPTTPSAHAPDTGDLTNQNSNDSSSGPAPGTPNSQGMRPTPSPTGSTGSRSMSPAVGQQNISMPPRPSSGQSDSGGPTRMSHSPMAQQGGNYQQQQGQHLGPPPPHLAGGYKMPGGHPAPPSPQQQGGAGMYGPNSAGQPAAGSYPPQQAGGYTGPGGGVRPPPPHMQQYGYGAPPGQQQSGGPITNNTLLNQPYPNRPLMNHVPHSQYGGYQQQGWNNQVPSGKHTPPSQPQPQQTGGQQQQGPPQPAGQQQQQQQQGPGTTGPRPPHYLKQHLQHKMQAGATGGYIGGVSTPQAYTGGSPQSMGPQPMGPPSQQQHPGMGPPTSMGPPPPNMAPPPTSAQQALPSSHVPNSHDGSQQPIMPPPSSTPNSHGMPPHSIAAMAASFGSGPGQGGTGCEPPPPPPPHAHSHSDMMDNGITTTATSNMMTHVTSVAGGSVTSVVTTGPDGTTIDEGSQQSTLSNTSAASGEDHQCTTPKSRKNEITSGGHYSHPATPQSTVPSPGAASMNSMHEEYDMSSPSWPRTPASPVFNSHVATTETYRSKKTDSLGKLYEMDDSPERRAWLDKLLAFMEERRTPITTCPTISKNPLDLFRLYMYVKERGGFMEVTKNKTWKDIAGMLGIGASSSAAYTLRKHYTKNLLAYECQFDRGGIDPQPIINQVEASSKKKNAKSASVPSPGSSNSQDSFPPPGSSSTSMDGYGNYGGYPPGSTPDYNPTLQRPSSQANAPSPHAGAGMITGNHHAGGGAPSGAPAGQDNVNVSNPFDDVSPSPPPRPATGGQYATPYGQTGPPRQPGMQQTYGGQSGYNQYPGSAPGASPEQYQQYPANAGYSPGNRNIYQQYGGPEGDSSMSGSNYGQPRAGYGPTAPPNGPPAGSPSTQSPAASYPAQQEYYRSDQAQGAPPPTTGPNNQMYLNGPPNKTMPPPAAQPRRHPDFTKDQQQYVPPPPPPPAPTPYNQQRPQIYGWPNSNQYRGQYQPPSNMGPSSPQQWNQSMGNRPAMPHNSQNVNNQWDQRYPPSGNNQSGVYPAQGGVAQQNQQWSPMPTPGIGQSSPLRPPIGPRTPFRSDGKPIGNIMQSQTIKNNQNAPGVAASAYPQQPLPKREISFPPDSVEATIPVLYRRKRLCRLDMPNVDAWKIMMSLRSGLVAETTYALDALNVLLYDDSTVSYFGLGQWPGLLDLLLEHFRKSLSDMFDVIIPNEPISEWYQSERSDPCEVDLGAPDSTNVDGHDVILLKTPNHTHVSRRNGAVKQVEKTDDIFIRDDHKDWDRDGDEANTDIAKRFIFDNWQMDNMKTNSIKFILPSFQSEFNNIKFFQHLDEKETAAACKANSCAKIKKEDVSTETEVEVEVKDENLNCSDKKKRTKTLSDVVKDLLTQEEQIKSESKTLEEDQIKSEYDGEASSSCEDTMNANSKDATQLSVRDEAGTLKRRRMSDYEDECYTRDEASLCLITETQDTVARRCVCISNILRNLTFIPGNEAEFAKSTTFLGLLGKLLLLHHEHPVRTHKTRNYDREEDADFGDSCSSLHGEMEWWWDFLVQIRENVLVSCANISGHMNLGQYSEMIARPILDGLLHWAICPSAHGQDPFTNIGATSLLSPQRLALESLCKLCVTDSNVDLVIATPPFSRLERLCSVLTKHLCRSEDQVLREFSVNLLHYLAAADSAMARVVAMQSPCVSLLVAFIEQAEQSALGVANQHGISALRENPDSMGTSLDMLRRAAGTLLHLAKHPDNRPLFLQQEQRLLHLVMSQILDQQVAFVIARVLFHISRTNDSLVADNS